MEPQINPSLSKLTVPIDTLRPDPQNARRHEARSIDAIKASLTEYGQQKPIVALADGTVIAGNGTLEAAKQLGWKKLAVVKFADEKKARAFALADNRTAELSDWDNLQLAKTLEGLSASADWNPAVVGFTDEEMMKLIASASEADIIDNLPPAPLPPVLPADSAPPADLPTSHVRMVQLFLDDKSQPRFIEAVKKLAKVYGTVNTTDTVLRCVEQVAAQLDPKTADAKQAPTA